ncbi:oxidoreductase [Actinoplanes ianthinogenes]|uniref:Oxidoreductase n=1 Tax=Actinoplanes ianthinogenes TaxID=122358 RepID=A0ABN6CGW9_9ACTN|nr:molybdopterin-dependent oxidoreductase [Actinoplanes ianthinogenes]BCJ44368.1 oxidoreductase [Actinoplanes ianthinogenes]GGQ97532.1 oxidoreductase [Actinoplanes ianthinogenes]
MRIWIRDGLAGVAAAAAALGVAELLAVFGGPRSAPLVAVGGVVVDHVPAAVKDAGIAVFGVHDKTALLTGTAILLGLYAFGVGVLARRRWPPAVAGIALFGLIGAAAALTRPGAGAGAAIPALFGAALAVPVLRHLIRLTPDDKPEGTLGEKPGGTAYREADGPGEAESRRRFLKQVGIVAAVAAGGGAAGRWLTSRGAVTEARDAVTLPAPVEPAPVVPAAAQVGGAVPYVTPNKDFYRIDTALITPQVDPSSWTLRIHGMVRNPITVTWAELLRRPMVERYVTLACVSNEVGGDLIGNALWLGTPIKALLDEADPLPGADQAVQRSRDGWTCGTPTAVLRDGRDALLAVGMNGEPLPVDHGFPVRMVVPGLYGYVSACKWITEIELTRFADFDAYWVPRGWAAQAPIKTQSRIDTPRDGAARQAGPVVVAGVAWAQHRGIAKVEVQVDDGPWEVATLAPAVSDDTWRQWTHTWQAAPGKHVLRVRATDLDGYTQTSDLADPAPDGATGWHQVAVAVG